MTDPLRKVWDALEQAGCQPKGQPWNFRARCPGHDGDNDAALHVSAGADGRALLCCHAHGCPATEVARQIGLDARDLFPDSHRYARLPGIAKPRAAIDVILDAVRECDLSYCATNSGDLWVVERCPACSRGQLWVHEDVRGAVRCACMNGCDQYVVLDALAGVSDPKEEHH